MFSFLVMGSLSDGDIKFLLKVAIFIPLFVRLSNLEFLLQCVGILLYFFPGITLRKYDLLIVFKI